MISVLNGFMDTIVSLMNSDFIIIPVASAVIASLTMLIFGIIKGRG